MSLIIDNHFIYFTASDAVGKKLDATYVKSRGMYKVPNTLGALRELHAEGYDVASQGRFKALHRQKMLDYKNTEDDSLYLCEQLRPYQRQDISYLHKLPHAGVFNSPRTGKSATVLKLLELEQRKKNLIVCPASLVLNWSNEIRKWIDSTPFPVSGDKKKRMKIYQAFSESEEGILIISKETLRQDVEIIEAM